MGPEPKGERLQAIAGAIALRAMGSSWAEAAILSGIPSTTVQRWTARVSRDPGALKQVEEQIVDCSADAARVGFELILERMPRMEDGKLIAATGMATDKLAMYRGWGKNSHGVADTAAGVVDRLAQLEGKLSITIERTKPEE